LPEIDAEASSFDEPADSDPDSDPASRRETGGDDAPF
jgi:hypothetical protein